MPASPLPLTAQDLQFVYENTVTFLAYYFRLKIPPFVKARTVLEELRPQYEETMNNKEEPGTEAEEVVMINVLVMNRSYVKIQ